MPKLCVKIGTISYVQREAPEAGEVVYEGEWLFGPQTQFGEEPRMIWDAGLNNARAMTQPEIDAIPAQRAAAFKAEMVALVTAAQREAVLTRAVVLVALDEFNSHATKINAILTAVDGAATLAALKTAVSAIADYPQRTKAQLLAAMQGKINAGDTD